MLIIISIEDMKQVIKLINNLLKHPNQIKKLID